MGRPTPQVGNPERSSSKKAVEFLRWTLAFHSHLQTLIHSSWVQISGLAPSQDSFPSRVPPTQPLGFPF